MTEQTPPRPPFKVSGMATIKHLNVRKEGPDDEKILAVDVKLEIKQVDRRLCGYFDEALEAFLWRGNTDALIARNQFMAPVQYFSEISSASVQIGNENYSGCDVKKFSLQPQDGGVMTLTCSVALYPSSADVSELAKLVQDDASVTIEGPPDLFAGELVPGVPLVTIKSNVGGDLNFDPVDGADPLYEQAVAIVKKNDKASISLVQRHLKIGYNRAARLLEQMEAAGKVSAMDSMGSRKVQK